MNIARFSVTRPVAVTMRIAALVLLGAVFYTRLPVDLLPNVSLPTVAITTQWPNVSPEEIETQVTRPIEEAASSAPNLYQVSSNSDEGVSSVRVQFNWGTDIGQAAVDVLQLVERARRNFPTDPTLQTPVVFKFDPSQTPILVYGVSGMSDQIKLKTLLQNEVTPLVESANGVAAVTVTGGLDRTVVVNVDPDRLRAHGLSLSQIGARIAQENINQPAGIAKESDTEYTIRSLGLFTSVAEMKQIPVGSYNGKVVSLGDVADVTDGTAEVRVATRLNQQPAVGLLIVRQSGANTLATTDAVLSKIDQVKKLYPQLQFRLSYDQSRFIRASVDRVKEDGLIGSVLAILILLFFLRNLRSTLVVALSIPISVVSTFALLYVCGFTINTMSLSGLALAIGLIVDDAVVVLENIFRHIERDKRRAAESAVTGTQEILTAVVASTITIMIVFLPLLLIKGQAGQMFTQLALVVIFSIGVSLLDAATVVPMLASRLIKTEDYEHGEEGLGRNDNSFIGRFFRWAGERFTALDTGYRDALAWALKHRFWVVGGAFGLCALSLLLVPFIGIELWPLTDSGDVQVNIKMPIGTSYARTNQAIQQMESILLKDPNVETVFSAAGTNLSLRGTSTTQYGNQGAALVKLKDNRKKSTQEVINDLRKQLARGIPGAQPRMNQVDLVTQILTGGNQNVEVDIFGQDLGTLSNLAQEVIAKTRDVSGFENVDVNWQDATPELQWKVDRAKATQLGLSFQDIATTIGTATNGSIPSYYQENGYQYPIQVQLPEADRKTVSSLLSLPLKPSLTPSTTSSSPAPASGRGGIGVAPLIELRQVATPVFGTGPSEITRLNRQRYIAVTGTPEGRSPGEIQKDIEARLQGVQMPAGYHWAWGTNQQQRNEEFAGMGLAVFLAIALIYMVLASQFESFVHPLTILVSVPLAVIGVILALFLTGRSFGLTAFIGLLLLVGIVVKNGILLIDYTNLLRSRGRTRDDAVLEASPTRLRPILMTSLAAGFGMLPLALGLGEGSETQAPLATAVVGGLTTSTLLTLFVVPCIYTLFDDLARRFRGGDSLDLDRPPLVEPSIESVARDPMRGGPDEREEEALLRATPEERRGGDHVV